jgi:ATP-dependent RNA helicase SUPV3L1/SUV3
MGLTFEAHNHLLKIGGFTPHEQRPLAEGMFGPPSPTRWRWRTPHRRANDRDADPRTVSRPGTAPRTAPAERQDRQQRPPRHKDNAQQQPRRAEKTAPKPATPDPNSPFAALAVLVRRD